MKNAPSENTEFKTPGQYLGQCRKVFNILEQWDGKKWRAIPDVVDRRPQSPAKLHFFPD